MAGGNNDTGSQFFISSSNVNASKEAGFTMPSGNPYSLDSIDLRLRIVNTTGTPQLTNFSLFADVGNNPGESPLVDFDLTAFNNSLSTIANGTVDTFNFTPISPFTLSPDTTYWFAVRSNASSSGIIAWRSNNPNIAPTGIATSAGYRINITGVFPPTTVNNFFSTYQLNGTEITSPPVTTPEGSNVVALIFFGGVLVMGLKSS
ncbi:MAG: hypothetical protein IGQ45_01610 [Cyanobacterium sp. T60_A2020_053]|nr:hypothetical protein [Cyanobacterium sp. T60_A2020_053]